jgi:hypothetical protein
MDEPLNVLPGRSRTMIGKNNAFDDDNKSEFADRLALLLSVCPSGKPV